MNMPISEDELDNRNPTLNNEPSSTMSKAELRKTHKPIMEKRRRARINQCLNEIKTLILEAMKKDPARHSKLEKADILEMAVKHLQNVQRQQLAMAIAGDPTVLRRFKTGFEECARQVSTYIDQIDQCDDDATTQKNGLKGRIAEHLSKCMGSIEHVARFNLSTASSFPFFPTPFNTSTDTMNTVIMSARSATNFKSNSSTNNNNNDEEDNKVGHTTAVAAGDDLNNNPASVQQRSQRILHLIPSRLPTGELAFLLPNSDNLSRLLNANSNSGSRRCSGNDKDSDSFSATANDHTRHRSAFVAVTPSSPSNDRIGQSLSTISPPPSPADEDGVSQNRSSPKRGFRPFNSALQRSYRSAFLSTAKFSAVDLKVDRQTNERKPGKSVEPLCIITNQSERFKQAQILANSVNCEENRHAFKRQQIAEQNCSSDIEWSYRSHNDGLLIVSGNNQHYHRLKDMKTASQFRHNYFDYNMCDTTNKEPLASEFITSKESDNGVDNSDMWRPW